MRMCFVVRRCARFLLGGFITYPVSGASRGRVMMAGPGPRPTSRGEAARCAATSPQAPVAAQPRCRAPAALQGFRRAEGPQDGRQRHAAPRQAWHLETRYTVARSMRRNGSSRCSTGLAGSCSRFSSREKAVRPISTSRLSIVVISNSCAIG